MIYPVILSGGSGSRLWPASRISHPKQFLAIVSEKPMIIETAERVNNPLYEAPTIICNVDHRFLVGESFTTAKIVPRQILLEPVARNTTAAIVAATYSIYQDNPEALVLIMPSDHMIKNIQALHDALVLTKPIAEDGWLVTFGIKAARPNTGYGYIERGCPVEPGSEVMSIVQFHEKPDIKTATEYIKSGRFCWNSGLFFFAAKTLLQVFRTLDPDNFSYAVMAVDNGIKDLDFYRLDPVWFSKMPSEAFDVSVMEKHIKSAVLEVEMGWSDIGSWSALHDVSKQDNQGNTAFGEASMIDTHNSLVWNGDNGVVATVGIEDLLVVVKDGSVLVTSQKRAEDVKKLVEQLENSGLEQHLIARTVHRPWGCYRSLDVGEGYLVKRIEVKPGARLSLQYHNYRAEHWVVVCGTARVTSGEKTYDLDSNESTYLPIGTIHRLENIGSGQLVLIEVQTGVLLSEEDIIRLDDVYGRKDVPGIV
ncbi:mannose-1-phosphate guanylyltransferase/mannose-6-phosphate isomerase [Kiloniella laminariae]|uniref:mannose-1-phosphate guanylyltransferase/mannose-6-phosphate isomerase n=1 Tax=Kiloniella laminariae TaxID=454162 RepID=UPI0003A950E0|nr:mannose-1-phosphate guanylyltransferase/mannose-6-phosphate isomerase [Kiloniella laminariae]